MAPELTLQEGWRWCRRCQCLVHGGAGHGVCHDSAEHDFGASGAYRVLMGGPEADPLELAWRWCHRCQVLFYIGHSNGVCWDGASHDPSRSSLYHLQEGTAAGEQEGWRRCNRCQSLAYGGDKTGRVGVCHDGDPHFLSDRDNYRVPHEPLPAAEPPPVTPTLRVSEWELQLAVEGRHFTPGARVTVSFQKGTDVRKLELGVDETGAFYHVEDRADPSSGGGRVIARDAAGRVATGRTERLLPRKPPGPVLIDHGTALEPVD